MNFKKNWKRFWTLSSAREGFTLVELIVVIAILAILAGVAVPAYSGYVKKAERAADEQLLAALNTAFASACAINGESHIGRDSREVKGTIDKSTGKFTYEGPFGEDFDGFYEDGEFKTIVSLYYDKKIGGFAEVAAEWADLYEKIKNEYGDEMAALAASNFGAMGAETLMTEIAGVIAWASANGILGMAGDSFNAALAGYLGLEADATEDEIRDAMLTLAGGDTDLASKIGANAIALYAAQNTSGLTMDGIKSWLGGSTDAMQANPNANTLSEAAAIYGLYMSYLGDDFDSTNGAVDVLTSALTDDDFKAWLDEDEGKNELNAYIAAMSVIGSAADSDTADSVLLNGFDAPELIALLESLMGN